MANNVYGTITVHEAENWDRLEEIVKVGVAEFYMPMPKALDISAPALSKEEKRIAKNNHVRYGYENGYDWLVENHGTKTGDYSRSLSGDNLVFRTAYTPLSLNIIKMFALDFPNFTYVWEEEQGYGERYEFEDGEITEYQKWDIPPWAENKELTDEEEEFCYNNSITWLSEDYELHSKGFYESHNLDEFLGYTIDEVKRELDL